MVLDDLADGSPEKRNFGVVPAADAGNQDLQNRMDHGPQDSPSPNGLGCRMWENARVHGLSATSLLWR